MTSIHLVVLGIRRGRGEVWFSVRVFGWTYQTSNDGIRSPNSSRPEDIHAASRNSTRDDLKTEFRSDRHGRVASHPYKLTKYVYYLAEENVPAGVQRRRSSEWRILPDVAQSGKQVLFQLSPSHLPRGITPAARCVKRPQATTTSRPRTGGGLCAATLRVKASGRKLFSSNRVFVTYILRRRDHSLTRQLISG